jgi:hypothetical protein
MAQEDPPDGTEHQSHDDDDRNDALVASASVDAGGSSRLLALVLGARDLALALVAGHGVPFDVTAT